MSINIKNFVFCLIWIKNFPYNNNNCMLHFFDEKIRRFLEYFLKIFYLKIFRLLKRKSCKLDNIVCSRPNLVGFFTMVCVNKCTDRVSSSTSQWYIFLLFMQFDKTNFIPLFLYFLFILFIPLFLYLVAEFFLPIMLHSIDILVLKCKCLLITLMEDTSIQGFNGR